MQKYIKRQENFSDPNLTEGDFAFSPSPLQGARVGKKENAMYIISPRRFKLYTDSADELKILKLNGKGHFKWARGETPFVEGDAFEICGVGEYEVTADCTFIVIRK